MNIAAFIAGRYLFAKKSHNVINIISAISAIGMAIGTAALVIILSVYNGFDSLIRSMMSNVEPDLLITPATGKVFIPEGEVYDWIYDQPEVFNMCCVLEDDVFISYDSHQGVAKAKGVDWIYEEESPLKDHIRDGEFRLRKGDIPMAVTGDLLAEKMGINPRFLSPIEIYYPSRTKRISLANPTGALESIKVFPAGLVSVNDDIDKGLLIISIDKMRELLKYENEVSGVEIRLVEGTTEKVQKKIQKEIQEKLGPEYIVKNRLQQNEVLYKMMKYEKIATYMVLFFAIIIIAFNIFGSLTMLIIEKRDDIQTLRHLGAEEKTIRNIFTLEGWLISLTGMAAGLVIGIVFALIQQHFGIIKMPGHFVVQAYPIILSVSDILFTAIGVAIIGYIIALIPSRVREL
ncbi:MAG: ABC transporter permease [Bacteroidales bacterium]|jgi:ABC-type lipoprotein release transport system permease subunit|nr:ABC transporter permease [Bacteroidales bacterium]